MCGIVILYVTARSHAFVPYVKPCCDPTAVLLLQGRCFGEKLSRVQLHCAVLAILYSIGSSSLLKRLANADHLCHGYA